MVKNDPRISELVPKGKTLSINLQIGVKWSQIVKYGLQGSSMLPNGPKWSNKNQT